MAKKKNLTISATIQVMLDKKIDDTLGIDSHNNVAYGNLINSMMLWTLSVIPEVIFREKVLNAIAANEFYKTHSRAEIPPVHKANEFALPWNQIGGGFIQ